jgi:hypothetical protein
MDLGEKSRQIFELKGLICKILANKELVGSYSVIRVQEERRGCIRTFIHSMNLLYQFRLPEMDKFSDFLFSGDA